MAYIKYYIMKNKYYLILSVLVLAIISSLGYFYLVKPEIDSRAEKKEVLTKKELLNTKKKPKTIALGLDLVGGSQLTYNADISAVKEKDVDDTLESLKQVLAQRLNPFGTSEVSITLEKPSIFANSDQTDNYRRVIVQIPGVADPEEAKKMIGKIPTLEFKIQKDNKTFENTKLTGRYLETARLNYDGASSKPIVSLKFTDEGADVFGDLTAANVGKVMAIFLDGEVISAPVIKQAIRSNTAIIEGNFTSDEAKELARNLRFGALPVPVKLISSNTISASLGNEIMQTSLKAAAVGLVLVMLFLIIFYGFSGVAASLALISYIILTISMFKLFGFVFTAAGIAGFIISIGMAVDANILIFERIKEELRKDKKIKDAVKIGFQRAWLSIRDGNISSILTAIILFYMTTSLIKGFALTFGFGVMVSMFSAIVITRIFLYSMITDSNKMKKKKLLFGHLKNDN